MLTAVANLARVDPAPADWSLWLPLVDAAATLGLSVTQAKRLAREKLGPSKLAIKTHPANGGKAAWFIARTHVESVQNEGRRERAAFDKCELLDVAQKERLQTIARHELIRMFDELRADGLDEPTRLARVITHAADRYPELAVSRSSLHRWRKKLLTTRDVRTLVDGRSTAERRERVSPEAKQDFLDRYVHGNQPRARKCWRQTARVAAANGWTWCSYANVMKQLNAWCPEVERIKVRNPRHYRNSLQPRIIRTRGDVPPGREWLGDHKQLDVFVRMPDGKQVRPWLTTWMDHGTRKIVGYYLSDGPNSSTILAAFRSAMLDEGNLGGPDRVRIDNGKDYAARMFTGETKAERRRRRHGERATSADAASPAPLDAEDAMAAGLYGLLGIEPHFTLPYNPTGKSPLERWHDVLKNVCDEFDTYTGISPESRPEQLNANRRDPSKVPTFDTFKAALDAWISDEWNHNPEHNIPELLDRDTHERRSPADAFARWTNRVKPFSREALDLMLMRHTRPLSVGKNGLRIVIGRQSFHFGSRSHELAAYKSIRRLNGGKAKRQVIAFFRPEDQRQVYVYEATGSLKFVCVATLDKTIGSGKLAEQDIRDAQRELASHNRARRVVARTALIANLPPAAAAEHVAAQRRQRERLERERNDPPRSLRIAGTPVDGQVRHVRAAELRKAAGAESMSPNESGGGFSLLDSLIAENEPEGGHER